MIENLTPEQMTIFNYVMRHSFYHPIVSQSGFRSEPVDPTDTIQPSKNTSFFTEYFENFGALHDRDDDIFEHICADSLCEFINEVSSIICQLSSRDEGYILEDAKDEEVEAKAYFKKYNITLEEEHSAFQSTRMVSQLLRYRAAYGWMGYFQDAA